MKMKEVVDLAQKSEYKGIVGLIAVAYLIGKHDAAKECCDKAKKVFEEQKTRAKESKYLQFASMIIGNTTKIYHPDYTSVFPEWEMEEILKEDTTK